jgi:hypothetical protein
MPVCAPFGGLFLVEGRSISFCAHLYLSLTKRKERPKPEKLLRLNKLQSQKRKEQKQTKSYIS